MIADADLKIQAGALLTFNFIVTYAANLWREHPTGNIR